MGIKENFSFVRERAAQAAVASHRNAEDVKIIAVSKTFPASAVQEAINAGVKVFGENRVQEAKEKIPQLTGNMSFHLIGHLQSNKAKQAVALFDVIHSVDTLHIAETINSEAKKLGKTQKILVQINSSGEQTKSGAGFEDAVTLAGRCMDMSNIDLLGFMTIGPLSEDAAAIGAAFAKTKQTLDTTNARYGTSLRELSMGMSGDFETAIKEGATMIRVGSLIFGRRNYDV